MGGRCANCRAPDAEERDLLIRSDPGGAVHLCEACYSAFEKEFVWGEAATRG